MLVIPQLGWALFALNQFFVSAVARALFLARALGLGGIWDGEKMHARFRRRAGLAWRFG